MESDTQEFVYPLVSLKLQISYGLPYTEVTRIKVWTRVDQCIVHKVCPRENASMLVDVLRQISSIYLYVLFYVDIDILKNENT